MLLLALALQAQALDMREGLMAPVMQVLLLSAGVGQQPHILAQVALATTTTASLRGPAAWAAVLMNNNNNSLKSPALEHQTSTGMTMEAARHTGGGMRLQRSSPL